MPLGADVKWRYFWRLGPRPEHTAFPELNACSAAVVPAGMPEWAGEMDAWGGRLLDVALAVAELLAVSYGLPHDAFSELLREGPHLLAPTGASMGSGHSMAGSCSSCTAADRTRVDRAGTDLREHGALGTVFAGYHYDLNFLSIHGRARYPGLHVWLRDGTRVAVRLPPGCLLLQVRVVGCCALDYRPCVLLILPLPRFRLAGSWRWSRAAPSWLACTRWCAPRPPWRPLSAPRRPATAHCGA